MTVLRGASGVFRFLVLAGLVWVPMLLYAAGSTASEYTIKKGDTLWDISSTKYSDPFKWKRIWKANPYIRNPHWIYPGRPLVIPDGLADTAGKGDGSLLRITPRPIEPQPIPIQKTHDLMSREDYLKVGSITQTQQPTVGRIIGAGRDKTILGRGDFFYFVSDGPTELGTKYYIYADPVEISHPITKEKLGTLQRVIGVAQVVPADNDKQRAEIIEAYREVNINNALGKYTPVEAPYYVDQPRTPAIQGVVVKIMTMDVLGGNFDAVYIDRGMRDGVRFGDEFKLFAAQAPNAYIGTVKVINVTEATSSAIVKSTNGEILIGDMFKN
ncbi:MAG TPA: LysM peptidoglycan-binding domain-containing protein [Dissulfurispiraceae bacterium]|nr:LysM peptidoglycan-binding domain-containing protein [Dissulfurispiraceae bacterium]